jgi:hypothetical protein
MNRMLLGRVDERRDLMRCPDIPMEWQQQRHFLGFS